MVRARVHQPSPDFEPATCSREPRGADGRRSRRRLRVRAHRSNGHDPPHEIDGSRQGRSTGVVASCPASLAKQTSPIAFVPAGGTTVLRDIWFSVGRTGRTTPFRSSIPSSSAARPCGWRRCTTRTGSRQGRAARRHRRRAQGRRRDPRSRRSDPAVASGRQHTLGVPEDLSVPWRLSLFARGRSRHWW